MAVKLVAEVAVSRQDAALLLSVELRRTTMARIAAGLAGGVLLPLALAGTTVADGRTTWLGAAAFTLSLLLIVAGELLERSLFFTTASPPR
jgi:hypothetical protein